MEKVNNVNGIELYFEIEKDYNKFTIYDSSKNYFNDLELEEEDFETDFKMLRETLEQTSLEEMCSYFGCALYDDYKKLIKENGLNGYREDNILDCDWVNRFVVRDKVYYTFH